MAEILISLIKVGAKRRAVDSEKARLLAESIQEIGLLSPVVLSRNNALVAGQHRIEAFKLLGRKQIPFYRIDREDDLHLRLAEIDENLVRNDGTELDKAEWLSERKRIYESLYPETKRGNSQSIGMNKSLGNNVSEKISLTFTQNTAQSVGLTPRSIQMKVKRADDIPQDVRDSIRDTKLADNGSELDKLAKLAIESPEKLRPIVEVAIKRDISINEAASRLGTPIMQSSKENEYYTPIAYLEAVRQVMGRIDLDPASCEIANQTVKAGAYYTIETDGLAQVWRGNVWLNPPYGRLAGDFAAKLLQSYLEGQISQGILLVNANITDTKWFAPFWDYLICFTNHRINFMNSDDKSGSTHGSLFVYLGGNTEGFIQAFKQFGVVVKRVDK